MNRWSITASLLLHALVICLFQLDFMKRDGITLSSSEITPITIKTLKKSGALPARPSSVAQPTEVLQKKVIQTETQTSPLLRTPTPKEALNPSDFKTQLQHSQGDLLNSKNEAEHLRLSSSAGLSAEEHTETTNFEESSPNTALVAEIRHQIHRHLLYPSSLRKAGIEGRVVVQFLLSPEGQLLDLTVRASSGHPQLDTLALHAVEDASPFTVSGQHGRLRFTLPIQFKITAE